MVVVAQLVRAPDCGSGGRRFEPGLPPNFNLREIEGFLILNKLIRIKILLLICIFVDL